MNNTAGVRALFGADGTGYHSTADSTAATLANWTDGDLKFVTNASERMRIHNTGEIEVNSAYKLPPSAGTTGQLLTMVTSDSAGWNNPVPEPLAAETTLPTVSPFSGVSYYKDRGRVYFEGSLQGLGALGGADVQFASLPVGFRPSSSKYIIVPGIVGGSLYRIEFRSNGQVLYTHWLGSGASFVDLDGISIRVD